MADVKQIAETLVGLTVKEVQDLAKILKDEYGIEPAAATVVAGGGGGGNQSRAVRRQTPRETPPPSRSCRLRNS